VPTDTTSPDTSSQLKQTDVFIGGQDGSHTYRIPSVVVAPNGELLAFCEARRMTGSDTDDIDLVLKRSADSGATWGEMQVIWDDGPNTCGNPCAVVDQETGTVWLLACHNLVEDHETTIWKGESKSTRTIWAIKSDDSGASWSSPVEITSTTKAPNWSWYATGPGSGIQLQYGVHKGRLVIPCDHGVAGSWDYHSHVFYSDDHGETWKLGGSVPDNTTSECQVVELADGTLVLSIRYHAWVNQAEDPHYRTVAFSRDSGETWGDVRKDRALIDPRCQASVFRHTSGNAVLFSNPANTARDRMTVRASYDEGKTWHASKMLHPGPSAYSCLTVLPDNSIGCFYERGEEHSSEKITFARFSLEWLSDAQTSE
jgi:sialidase-1